MKIGGFGKIGPGGDIPKKKTENSAEKPFDSLLRESMGKKGEETSPASGPLPQMRVQPSAGLPNAFEAEAVKAMESLLDDMEMYRNALGNGDIPLGRLSPMLDELAGKKDRLVAMMSHVEDPRLKSMMAETASLLLSEDSLYHALL